jgi:SSS family solute:Na+ symporter
VRGLFVVALLATIMSTVDTYSFLAAQTAGRDLYGRLKGRAGAEDAVRWTRWGLVATCLISIALALHFGSVIAIWHDLGSIATPALLVPVASALSRRWRLRAGWALAAMLAGGGLSFLWVLSGYVPALRGSSGYLGGIEPIYPGLAASVAVFAAGRVVISGGVGGGMRPRNGR